MKYVLLGDVNAGQIGWNNMAVSSSVAPHVEEMEYGNEPTQFRKIRQSLLNLAFTKGPSDIVNLSHTSPM